MPPVAAAAVAGIAAGSTLTIAGGLTLGFSVTAFAGSLVMSGLSMALSPKPDKPDLSSFASLKTTGYTQQFRQAVTDRRVVYGETRTSGPITFVGSTGDNEYLHMVIVVATHQIAGFEEFIINDESVPLDALDGNGKVTTGRYADHLWIKTYTGTDTQTADADLIAAFPGKWTSDHRGLGNAYMYLKFKFNQDIYPSGIPNSSAWLRGKLVRDLREIGLTTEGGDILTTEDGDALILESEDPATITPAWSPNIGLMAVDNLTDPLWGMRANIAKVDLVQAIASANTCDEMVTTQNVTMTATSANSATDIITLDGAILEYVRGDRIQAGTSSIGGVSVATDYYVIPYQRQGVPRIKLAASLEDAINGVAINITSSGTATFIKNAEPRYHGGGILKMSAERGANFQEILSGMGGQAIRTGGKWYVQAGEYRMPEVELTQADLRGRVQIVPQVSGDDRYNQVQGIYIGNINAGNPNDYPAVKSATYAAQDGENLKRTLDLSFTQRPNTAQRIGKMVMERSRQEIVFTAQFKLSAFKVRCGDNFYFTMDRYGWDAKVFECTAWRLVIERDDDGVNRPYIEMTCRENAAAVYDFNSVDDETTQDPAPNTDLPDPFTVTVVTGFSVTSIPVYTGTGDVTYKLRANWVAHENAFVREGGKYELWYKPTDQTEFSRFPINDGSATQTDLFQAEAGSTYDLQIRAINNLGAKSQFTTLYDFVVGTSIFTDTEDWEFLIMPRDPADWENNTGSAEDWEA